MNQVEGKFPLLLFFQNIFQQLQFFWGNFLRYPSDGGIGGSLLEEDVELRGLLLGW